MIKVLAVGMTGGIGGVETFMTNLYKHLDFNEVQMDFLVHENIAAGYTEIIQSNGNGKIYTVTGIKNNIFKYFAEIRRFYAQHEYDIIHLNECGASYFIYVLPVLFDKKTKLIVHSHNGDSARGFAHKLFRIVQNARTNAMWACSDVAAKWMFGEKKIKKQGYMLVHNGIDIEQYTFSFERRRRMRKQLNIGEETIVLGSVARFETQKNHNKIIGIFKAYHKINPNSILLLAGDGTLKNNIVDLVKKINLSDCVRFLGIRNDIPDLLQAFDVFLLPSLYEGLPFVSVEAQAASLPMIVSDNVSKQIDLTELIYRKSLSDEDEKWAKTILEIVMNVKRNDINTKKSLKEKGYDIQETTNCVTKAYRTLLELHNH